MPLVKPIFASTSKARQILCRTAGLDFEFLAPAVDESALKQNWVGRDAEALALHLAEAKALSISKTHKDHIIIGADQTLELDGEILDKANSAAAAKTQLATLRGKTHYLHSAVACAANGKVVFGKFETATLTMRSFSDAFLEDYLATSGREILGSVGCYHYEGLGIQLFEKVKGDYHTILGLPLLPLLAFLRQQAILTA